MARKVVYKKSGLNSQPTTPNGYKFVGYEDEIFSEKDGDIITPIGAGGGESDYLAISIKIEDGVCTVKNIHSNLKNEDGTPFLPTAIIDLDNQPETLTVNFTGAKINGKDIDTVKMMPLIMEGSHQTMGQAVTSIYYSSIAEYATVLHGEKILLVPVPQVPENPSIVDHGVIIQNWTSLI